MERFHRILVLGAFFFFLGMEILVSDHALQRTFAYMAGVMSGLLFLPTKPKAALPKPIEKMG